MKTTYLITLTIDRFPKEHVFTYANFTPKVNKKEAIIKASNRLVDSWAKGKCQIVNQKN